MVGFIKNARSWVTKREPVIITNYIISHETVYVERSSIMLLEGTGISEDDYLIITDLNFAGIIKEIVPQDGSSVVELRTEPMCQLFYRNLILPGSAVLGLIGTAGQGVEAFIKNRMEAEFKNNPDSVYTLPWLNITTESSTTSTMTVDNEDSIYTLTAFMAKAQRLHNIKIAIEPHNLALGVRIYRDSTDYRLIDLSKPDLKVEEEAFGSDMVAKCDVYCQATATVTHYYLLADGTVTTTPGSAERAIGRYDAISVKTADDIDQAARNVFASNAYSHLISFSRGAALPDWDSMMV